MLWKFEDFEHQDRADLAYGGQLSACQQLSEKDPTFTDHSITEEWIPDED